MKGLSRALLFSDQPFFMICCLNGRFMDVREAKVSVMDHGFLYSDGFYDTMKAFNGTILDLELHMARIKRSLKALAITLPWPLAKVQSWIEQVAQLNELKLARVRLTITRGPNDFDFFTSENPTLVITSEPIVIDPLIYKKGVSIFTIKLQRTLPEIKTIGVTPMILARRTVLAKGGHDAFFVDSKGYVTESTITNIFIVKSGCLYTPKSNILKGITRHEVIQSVRAHGLKVVERSVKLSELLKADEVFLANTKYGVTPVVKVDGKKIGDGKVGKMTKRVIRLHENYVHSYLFRTT